jgi:hypothetical protein
VAEPPGLRLSPAALLAALSPQEGVHAGRVVALQESVIEVLGVRFGAVPDVLMESLRRIADESRLRDLHRASLRCESIEEFIARV